MAHGVSVHCTGRGRAIFEQRLSCGTPQHFRCVCVEGLLRLLAAWPIPMWCVMHARHAWACYACSAYAAAWMLLGPRPPTTERQRKQRQRRTLALSM